MNAPLDTFVGRLRELEGLRGALDDAIAGHGRIVMLAGEPGIGKTRTAQELALHAAKLGVTVLWGRSHEEAGAPPYWPWVQVIRGALRTADAGALLNDVGNGASDIADIVPEIRDLVPDLEPSVRLADAAQARFRMFESIRQLFRQPGQPSGRRGGAGQPALGRCAVAASARVPRTRDCRQPTAAARHLSADRAVAPASAVRCAWRTGAGNQRCAHQPRPD